MATNFILNLRHIFQLNKLILIIKKYNITISWHLKSLYPIDNIKNKFKIQSNIVLYQ